MENNTEVTTELLDAAELTETVETVGTGSDIEIDFQPMNFVTSMKWLGLGMLGILIVMAIIIAATALLNKLLRDKSEEKNDSAQ